MDTNKRTRFFHAGDTFINLDYISFARFWTAITLRDGEEVLRSGVTVGFSAIEDDNLVLYDDDADRLRAVLEQEVKRDACLFKESA